MDKKSDGIHETVRYHSQASFLFHHNFSTHIYPNHWHNAVEIIMPIENGYTVDVSNHSYALSEYDIIIIPSGELHELRAPKTKGQRIILQFSLEALNTVRGFINASYIYAKPLLITPKDGPELHGFIKARLSEMLEEHLNRHIYYEVSITNKIISITLQLARKYKDRTDARFESFIKRKEHVAKFNECLHFIHHHYKDNLTLDMAAQAVGFSKYHFARWFRQLADLSFPDYLATIRIEKAEALLIGTSLPVTEIALEAGFQSASTFNRIFKVHKKCTPTEYRNFHFQKQQSTSPVIDKDAGISDATNTLTLKTPLPGDVPPANGEPWPGSARIDVAGRMTHPFLWADVPDPDVIRVGDVFYMTSTTMYFNPGIPVMKSVDLINWEIVHYVYDILDDSDACALRNGSNAYGKGTWASCLRYHRGVFYVAAASFTTNKTYIFQTEDIERGGWRRYVLDGVYHDMSMLFDEDDRVYLVYGGGTLRVIELTSDATAIKPGGLNRIIIDKADVGGGDGLPAEGSHLYKHNGQYYLFLIAWPKTGTARRIALCYRAVHIEGPYEGRVVLDDDLGYQNQGAAQGGIVEMPDGRWYAMLFQDHGAVGRIPVLVPVIWADGWPVLSFDAQPLPTAAPVTDNRIVTSDEFYAKGPARDFGAVNGTGYRYAHMSLPVSDVLMAEEDVELIVNGSFTEGTTRWEAMDIAKLRIAEDDPQAGEPVLFVSGRITTSSSPRQDITGKVIPGGVYEVFARVKYQEGPPQKDFNLCIRSGDTWEGIQIMGSGQLYRGEWGEIRGTYTLPEDADLSETVVFVETPWSYQPKRDTDLMDFYVACVSMKAKKRQRNIKTKPGENDPSASCLALPWQWNHNPDHLLWSLQQRPGCLRLRAAYLSTDLLDARNTLTQRTFGPVCAGTAALDISGIHDGDVAGLAALQELYGFVGVKRVNGDAYIIMVDAASGHAQEIESIPLWQNEVYLRVDFDYDDADKAYFYYSLDELHWRPIGHCLPMRYTLTHFTGYRFALFYYATQIVGGHADFKYFRVSDKLARHNEDLILLNAAFGGDTTAQGIVDEIIEISIHMEALPFAACDGLYFSMPLPDCLDVADVIFCLDNIKGDTAYTVHHRQLRLHVTGKGVSFANRASDLFALLRFRVNDYITEDQVVNLQPDYLYANGVNAAYRTHDMGITIQLKALTTEAVGKKPGDANPLIGHAFGAEPWAMEHDGRLYVYLTADRYHYNDHGRLMENTCEKITTLMVISSEDLLNWNHHRTIHVAGSDGAAPWAAYAGSPAVAKKTIAGTECFFLYFTGDAAHIGVLTADTPVGPWREPLGRPLLHRDTAGMGQTTGCVDPAVFVDDDGSAYLYFSCGHPRTAQVIRLGDDMISVKGEAVTLHAPAFMGNAGMHKHKGRYYYSYCAAGAGPRTQGQPQHGEIAYLIGGHPMGPFTYAGTLMKNTRAFFDGDSRPHHCLFTFKDQGYIAYQTQTLGKALNRALGYRSPHINRLAYFSDGHIRPVAADMKGVRRSTPLNPYRDVAAAHFAWSAGISVAYAHQEDGSPDDLPAYVTDIRDGAWLAVAYVDFGRTGAEAFTAEAASETGCEIEIRRNSPQGALIGVLGVGATGGFSLWRRYTCAMSHVTGMFTVFFVFKGDSSGYLLNIRRWAFLPFAQTAASSSPCLCAD